MEKIPQHNSNQIEILPPEVMKRGEIRSIADEIAYSEDQANRPGSQMHWYEVNEIGPLHAASQEGFNYVLRLPRVNEEGCVRKYGPVYDKVDNYMELIRTLAKRNNITDLKHHADSFWLFKTKEDAELLSRKLIEKQEQADLEFEIIERNSPTPIDDQTDTNL